MMEVPHRGSLAHELGIHADAKILCRFLPGPFFQQRDDQVLNRTWQDRAANVYDMVGLTRPDETTDVGNNTEHLFQVQTPIFITGRADTHKTDLAQCCYLRCGTEFSGGDCAFD